MFNNRCRCTRSAFAVALAFGLGITGCGGDSDLPEIGDVTGTVTLNGEPVEGASVEFIPEKGRPSSAITDESGAYTLSYSPDVDGAVVGRHTVSITTARAQQGGEGDQPLVEARPETIPQAYNDDSSLSVEVKPGDNTHDFSLEGQRGPENARSNNNSA